MKSATISDLIFLKALFKLVICELEDVMNFEILLLLIETIICLLKKTFSCHINSRFYVSRIIDYVVYIFNFLKIDWGNFL